MELLPYIVIRRYISSQSAPVEIPHTKNFRVYPMLQTGLCGSRREYHSCGWWVDAAHLVGDARRGQEGEVNVSHRSNVPAVNTMNNGNVKPSHPRKRYSTTYLFRCRFLYAYARIHSGEGDGAQHRVLMLPSEVVIDDTYVCSTYILLYNTQCGTQRFRER